MLKVAIAEDDFRVAQIQEEFLSKIKNVKVIGSIECERNDGITTKRRNRFASIR